MVQKIVYHCLSLVLKYHYNDNEWKRETILLLERIIDARDVTPSGKPLVIDPINDLNGKYRDLELVNLFTKLEKDEKVVKVLQIPSRLQENEIIDNPFVYQEPVEQNDNNYHIELLPAFDNFYNKIQQEAEDNYYITAKYLFELANRAYELFESSEVEERRQLANTQGFTFIY